jgi:hypothetical protein
MCEFKTLGVSWPPRGWEQLRHIKISTGQAVSKDPVLAKVTGLSYNIEPVPYYKGKKIKSTIYAVEVLGWEYTIHNESREYSVISFLLQERPHLSAPKEFYISDLKTMGQSVIVTERSAHRSLLATNFFIKQIISGKVPETERVLMLYKIHPVQRSLYEINNVRTDSLYCGLPQAILERNKNESVS